MQRFESLEEIQTDSQNVMKMRREMASRSASDNGNPTGITVLMPKGTASKGMVVNRNFGK